MSFGFGFGLPRAPLRGRPLVAAIRSLFAANEPGVWYDPSDLSTLFQDPAGTTPVTAVEQPVGLMLDKSKGLVLGSELYSGGEITPQPSAEISIGATVPGRWYRTFVPSGCQGNFGPGWNTTSSGTGLHYRLADGTSFRIRNFGASPVTFTPTLRELPGNHASQPTTTSRPVLSARVNLLTKTEQFDDAAWTWVNASVTSNTVVAPDGTMSGDELAANSTNSGHFVVSPAAGISVSLAPYSLSVYAKAGTSATLGVQLKHTDAAQGRATFNLATATAVVNLGTNAAASITDVGNGWYRCTLIATSSTTTLSPTISVLNAAGSFNYAGAEEKIYIWGADLRVANDGANLPPYQRVNTATDYDTVGFPHYLRFDGTDDGLVTPTITPGIDKVQVFAGVRKLSDVAHGMVVELGLDTSNTSNGAFCILSPASTITTGAQDFQSRGTVVSVARGVRLAPNTNILTGLGDISGDRATLRINGVQAAQNTADQGTGNYLAYPLYIGRRGGTTFPFNGRLYSLIVRFGSNLPAATIEKTEKYINTKTRAY